MSNQVKKLLYQILMVQQQKKKRKLHTIRCFENGRWINKNFR